MKKLKFLIQYGITKRLFKKSFIISNIIIGLLTILIVNIPNIIRVFDAEDTQVYHIEVLESNLESSLYESFVLVLDAQYYDVNLIDTFDQDTFFEQTDIDMTILLTQIDGALQVELYRFDTSQDQVILQTIQYLDLMGQYDQYEAPVINTFLPEDYEDPIIAEIMSGISTIFVLPLFLLMTFAIQFVGVDIIEEKSSKAIETIISSVKASTHFISKIVSSLVFITIQALLLVVFGLLGNFISSLFNNASSDGELASLLDILDIYFPNFGLILMFSILFIIVGAITYLVIAAVIAASATTQEDYQQFQAPIMITLVIGFYIGIFASTAGAENILKIAAFIPFFAPMTAPTAYALGAMTAFEMVISFLILIGTALLMIWILGPIYKVAILSYDQTKLIQRLKTYFKKSKALK